MPRLALPLILALGLTAAACGDGTPSSEGPSDVAYEMVAKDNVRARLRDPDSAEFTSVRVVRKGELVAICGYVNARNGFGGMTGPQRFISGGATVLESEMGPGEMDISWSQFC